MAGWYSAVVIRNGASALHHLLQPPASAVESDLNRGDGHSQEAGDLRRGKRVGFVQQNYGAVLIGQEIQTPLDARAGFLPLGNVERRGRLRNWRLYGTLFLFTVEGNKRLALAQTIEACVCSDAVQPAANGLWIA